MILVAISRLLIFSGRMQERRDRLRAWLSEWRAVVEEIRADVESCGGDVR